MKDKTLHCIEPILGLVHVKNKGTDLLFTLSLAELFVNFPNYFSSSSIFSHPLLLSIRTLPHPVFRFTKTNPIPKVARTEGEKHTNYSKPAYTTEREKIYILYILKFNKMYAEALPKSPTTN